MGKNGRHLDIYKFRNTCLFIYLFIHWLDRCPTQLNCEVFVRGKTQRTSTHLIPDSLHLKSFHHFRTYGCYSCTHNSVCSLLARCRASVKTHTQTYTNTHTDPLASFSFIFRNGMETEWNYLTMLAWYQAKAHITNSQRLNRCIDRFLVILNRFRGPRIDVVNPTGYWFVSVNRYTPNTYVLHGWHTTSSSMFILVLYIMLILYNV